MSLRQRDQRRWAHWQYSALTDEVDGEPRWPWLREVIKHRSEFLRSVDPAWLVERNIILLVIRSVDNSLTVSGKTKPVQSLAVDVKQGEGKPKPAWIPASNEGRKAQLLGQHLPVRTTAT